MSNWLDLVWIWIRCISVELTPNWVIQFGETQLLVSWCVGGKCDMTGSDKYRGRRRRLGVDDRGWSNTSRILGGRTIGRLGDAVCDHHTCGGDEKHGFSSLASKSVVLVCQWFDLKTNVTVYWFGSQNQRWRFGDLGIKITDTVSWFRLQNQVGGGWCLKADEQMNTVWGHMSTSSGLLHREARQARASEFWLKTGEGVTTGGAHGIIAEVTWKWSKRWSLRWRQAWCSGSWSKLPFIRCNFPFSPHGHSNLLFLL
jgi:hypothetical protein